YCWWECKLLQPLWKRVCRFLKKLNIELPDDPAIAPLGIYPKDTGVLIQRGTCTPRFIAALSTIAKVWKEPKYPSMGEQIKKMWGGGRERERERYNGVLLCNQKE
ncbi:LORF2 protein, partial [Crocuta crocuta]